MEVLSNAIKSWFRGEPFYHMWYCYMLIGVYLFAPFIIIFKNNVGEIYFEKVVWVFVPCACLSVCTSRYQFSWNIGLSFCYLGYFMLGYILRKRFLNNKSNFKGILLIVLGVIVELVTTYFRYLQAINGIIDTELKIELITPYSPLIVIASILIFSGFSILQINKDFSSLARVTLYIYLIHAGVWHILNKIVKSVIGVDGDSKVIIPVNIIIVLLISYVFASLYIFFWKKIEKKFKITDRICSWLKI